MTKISISRAWGESMAFLKADARLVIPVALTFLLLPAVVGSMIVPRAAGSIPAPGPWLLATPVIFVLRLIGALAISRLALVPAQPVGGALRHATRRMPDAAVAALLVMVPFALIAAPMLEQIASARNNPPMGASIGFLALTIAVLVVMVRVSFLAAVAGNEQVGAVAILRRSLALTRGNFLRLFGLIVLLSIVLLVLTLAVQSVIGSLIILTLGKPEPWTVSLLLNSLALELVDTTVLVILCTVLARGYAQQVEASPISGT